ncbi:MAG TPA: hypothetical protein GXX56_12545 [Rhodocyclaceae bacterium]|nr:hypothetical protein [Rhodocyclaceae bacterium]
MAGNQDARTGDAETGIGRIFDADKVQKEIDAQVQITQTFGQRASKAVGDYAETKLREAQTLRAQGREQEASELEAQWGANGTLRLAAHTLIGGLTGGASGAAGAAVGTLTAPAVADALAQAGIDGPLATAITALASTAAGAAVGGTAGGSTALNEVGNNYLSHPENKERAEARKNCASGNESACQRADELDALDRQRDMEFHAACDGELRATAGCADATRLMFSYLETYVGINPKEKAGDFAAEHKDELQSYIDLIKTASREVRTSTERGIQAPSEDYNPDAYGVVDKDNKKDAYLVMKFGDKALAVGTVNDGHGNYAVLSEWFARNGMLNSPDYATWLMFTHVDAAAQMKAKASGEDYLPVDRYTLSYAPTNGFFMDIWGTLKTKLGYESESVLGLRDQLESIEQGNQQVNWVTHSRGGVEFVQAAQGSNLDSLRNNPVVFHAGANTTWTTEAMMTSKNISDVIDRDRRYRDAPNDLVPQIVGLRALNSPWNIIPSLLYAPCLSSAFCSTTQSPHALPYQWNNLTQEGK